MEVTKESAGFVDIAAQLQWLHRRSSAEKQNKKSAYLVVLLAFNTQRVGVVDGKRGEGERSRSSTEESSIIPAYEGFLLVQFIKIICITCFRISLV